MDTPAAPTCWGPLPISVGKSSRLSVQLDPLLETIFLGLQAVAEQRRLNIIRVDLYETVVGAWREKCPEGVLFG